MTFLRYLGKFFISAGVGILLFVAWELWGTGFYTASHQRALADTWNSEPHLTAIDANPNDLYKNPPKSFIEGLKPGDPVFRIRIPKINLNGGKGFMVVEGVGEEQLKLGPGHYPSCRPGFPRPLCTDWPEVWPGEKGRVVISGHRTTYLHPFYSTDKLSKGDKIYLDTKWGDFTYEVYAQHPVLPTSETVVIEEHQEGELVLTTCNPPYSASQRLITYARLVASS